MTNYIMQMFIKLNCRLYFCYRQFEVFIHFTKYGLSIFYSFLDKIEEVKNPAYVPSDQDILRCRSLTTSIQHIEFEVPEGGNQVKFK